MRTIDDCIRGNASEIYMVEKSGDYMLVTAKLYDEYYFLKGNEVISSRRISGTSLYEIEVALLNHPKDPELLEQRNQDILYEIWLRFLEEQKSKK